MTDPLNGQLILRMPDGTEKVIAITSHLPKNHDRAGEMMPYFYMIGRGLARFELEGDSE